MIEHIVIGPTRRAIIPISPVKPKNIEKKEAQIRLPLI
jgi:hypothetical protein